MSKTHDGSRLAALAHEPWQRRWGRRALSITAYVTLFALLLTTLPIWLPLAALFDWLRGASFMTVRVLTGSLVFLAYEMIGIALSFGIWVRHRVSGRRRPDRFQDDNVRLQRWWAERLFGAAQTLFRLRLTVDAPPDAGRGPVLVFIRHSHLADALLPAITVAHRSGVQLRYVLKAELLWDPCFDIVGHRLPNCFVRRGMRNTSGDVENVATLLDDLDARAGVLIYPEGTRFTPAKRAAMIAQFTAAGDVARAQRVAHFHNVLPPRSAGPLSLLAKNPGADVLFVGHIGFEGSATAADTWRHRFLDRDLHVHCWRVPYAEIPKDPAKQAAWLETQWERMDQWVTSALAEQHPAAPIQIARDRPSQYGSRSLRL